MQHQPLCAFTFALVAAATGCSSDGTKTGNFGSNTGGSTSVGAPSGGTSMGNSGGAATGGSRPGTTGGSIGSTGTGGTTSSTGGSTPSTGGRATTGGSVANVGGTASTGGKSATGGNTSAPTGGTTTAGGSVATGGRSNTGGSTPTGGNTSTGGTNAIAGGRSSTGGSSGATGGRSSTGGTSGTSGSSAYHPCPTDGTACKIMPFGDSITDGYNGDTPGGYRVQLFHLAHAAGKNITFVGALSNGPSTVDSVTFPNHHEGHSGWTIYPAGGRLGISSCLTASTQCNTSQSVMTTYTPHIVLLMIGTNDCIDSVDLTNAPTRLSNLITTIYSQLPNVFIVVAQPIPSRGDASKGDDTGLSDRLKTYGDAIPAVVKSFADKGNHIQVVDMWTPFNPTKASLIEDQWHPNLAGYVVLGTEWYSVLQSLL